jgi:hypothetical protein
MSTLADKLGLGPTREAFRQSDGLWKVTVTPPAWSGFKRGSNLLLTDEQYARYQTWLEHGGGIDEIMPDLSPDEREGLQSGIPGPDFDDFAARMDDE